MQFQNVSPVGLSGTGYVTASSGHTRSVEEVVNPQVGEDGCQLGQGADSGLPAPVAPVTASTTPEEKARVSVSGEPGLTPTGTPVAGVETSTGVAYSATKTGSLVMDVDEMARTIESDRQEAARLMATVHREIAASKANFTLQRERIQQQLDEIGLWLRQRTSAGEVSGTGNQQVVHNLQGTAGAWREHIS